ncbi:Hypothetical protein A7982_08220 [Minicystis rosea]|nr:Hypothetical protein A7982_08220 [Minicystis rosea]
MPPRASKRRAPPPSENPADFVWPGPSVPADRPVALAPFAPIESLLALTGAVLATHTDGRVLVHPISPDHLGVSWELCRLDPAAIALVLVKGDLLAASGSRVLHLGLGGEVLAALDVEAPVSALAGRLGRAYAVAGAALVVIERGDAGLRVVQRIALPLARAHGVDVDRTGEHALVVEDPRAGKVVEIATGKVVGDLGPAAWMAKGVREIDARFSPVSEHVLAAYNRSHHPQKLSYRGRKVAELQQPSAWCTPLASSADGRWLAARQSGVGIIVWDLVDERQLLFAELDAETPHQAKFAKRMRAQPASIQDLGGGFLRVSRWRAVPELEGEATAVGVAPNGAYAVTGGRDGHVTVIHEASRRIERSNGAVLQKASLVATVPVPAEGRWLRIGADLLCMATDGTISIVDLDTGALRTPGKITAGPMPRVYARGSDLVIIEERTARAFDRETLAPRWAFEDPLPRCKDLGFDGAAIVGLEDLGGDARALHRFDPDTGAAAPIALTLQGTRLRTDDTVSVDGGCGKVFVQGICTDGHTRRFLVAADGTLSNALEGELLPDFEHVLPSHSLSGWLVTRAAEPSVIVASAEVANVTIGRLHVDLAVRRVVAEDMHTRRVHVFTLTGEPVASLDALGATHFVATFNFGETPRWLWILEDGGKLRRFDLDALA